MQSATGFYYLAVVTAFTAEVAVKTRFLALAMQIAVMVAGIARRDRRDGGSSRPGVPTSGSSCRSCSARWASPRCSCDRRWLRPAPTATTALLVGLGAGLTLYLGTRVFVWLAARWTPFRRDVLEKYGQAGEVTLATIARAEPRDHGAGRGAVLAGAVPGSTGTTRSARRRPRLFTWLAYVGGERWRAAACRSWRARSSAARSGQGSRGGRVACSRASRAISCGPG